MTENVIYTYDGDIQPAWQYYSMPHSCVGGGDTLDDARQSYREALAFQLDVDTDELPDIIEHVEKEARDGIYVRYAAADPLRDNGSQLVTRLLNDPSFFDAQLEEALHLAPTAGGYPVLVITQLDDPVQQLLDQLTIHDSIWLAFPWPIAPTGMQSLVGLISLAGEEADDLDAIPLALDQDTIDGMTVLQLVQRYAIPRAEKAVPTLPPRVKIAAMT